MPSDGCSHPEPPLIPFMGDFSFFFADKNTSRHTYLPAISQSQSIGERDQKRDACGKLLKGDHVVAKLVVSATGKMFPCAATSAATFKVCAATAAENFEVSVAISNFFLCAAATFFGLLPHVWPI